MESILQVNKVTYRYKKDREAALNLISMNLIKQQKTAIVGPNGAGKSTLLLHMNGLLLCESGEIIVCGEKITKANQSAMVRQVGLVFQDPDDQIVSLTVKDDIAFGPTQLGCTSAEIDRRVVESSQLLGIESLMELNPSELSYGQKKQVAIAGVLAMETEIIIFDEPMAFLDPWGKRRIIEIMDLLTISGKTIIVATHDMQFVAEWAEQVIIMKKGTCLGSMTPQQLFSSEAALLDEAHLDLPVVSAIFNELKPSQNKLPITIEEARSWVKEHNLD